MPLRRLRLALLSLVIPFEVARFISVSGAHAQEPAAPRLARMWIPSAATPAPPTWALQIAPQSRCASDPEFASELAEPIPAAQRAPTSSAELVAEVSVARSGRGLSASIHVFDRVLQSEAGARELSLPLAGCRETADAISLVIGVLVEAGRTGRPPRRRRPRTTPPPSPAPTSRQRGSR